MVESVDLLWPDTEARWDTTSINETHVPWTGELGPQLSMQTSATPDPTDAAIIDLAPITAACRGLVSWYDRHLSGQEPPMTELDVVVGDLRDLPPIPGRIGQDIDTILSRRTNREAGDVVGAVERLRLVANHQPAPPEPRNQPRKGRRIHREPKRSTSNGQLQLPGTEPTDT